MSMKSNFPTFTLFIFFCFQLVFSESGGQCPNSHFTLPSPVCSGSQLQFTNNSTGANSYKWDFSPGFFSKPAVKVQDTLLNLFYPGDITLAEQNDTTIVFISGFGNSNLYRVVYGNGPANPITQIDNFGTMGTLYQPSDMAVFKEGTDWYGFVVDYSNNYLFRISFGNSLLNTPLSITTVLTNFTSNLSSPWSIKINKDTTGNIYGLVCNHTAGSITILPFGNSILNTPTPLTPIVVPGTTHVLDAAIAQSCGNWYAFLAGNNSTNIIRAEFGNSFLNPPVFTTIISNGTPSDLWLVNDSSHWKLLYTNYSGNDTKKYDLGSDLSNITPVYLGSDYISGSNPKGICGTRRENRFFVYNISAANNLLTMGFTKNAPVSSYQSTDSIPTGIQFNQAGTYPITLVATDTNGNSSSFTDTVVVTEAPISNFSAANLCLGDNTLFTDSSIINSGTIASWKWDFGDSDTSSSQNPSHLFAATGIYNTKLITSSIYGCADTAIKVVNISAIPSVSFSYPPAACSMTEMQFTDQTTVAGDSIVNWIWDFGNGDSSFVKNPNYSFPAGGAFTINLTTVSSSGCSDSGGVMLTFSDRPQADFTTENTCVGQSVQFNDQTIISNSSITNYRWNFGDSNNDTTANPQHLYNPAVALYFAQLIVTAANGCKDTVIHPVKINTPPVVNFSINPLPACENNDVVFTDLSTVTGDTISGWYWDFGDSQIDSIKNPVHRYTTPGQYTITLTSYSPSRCSGTPFQQVIDVKASPVSSFNYSSTCLGTITQFTNNSIPAPGSSIDSVFWSFGALGSSNIYDPDFLFPAPGNYDIKLTVISQEGCIGIDSISLPVHDRPTANFNNTLPCTNDTVSFTNTSFTDSLSNIIIYAWNFGDPLSGINNTSSIPDPSHPYNSSQPYTVSLIVTTQYGCKDTSILSLMVNPAPTASFDYTPTCKGDLMQFINPGNPSDASYYWNFGDSLSNQLREPIHYYVNDGVYPVSLKVTSNMGCVTETTMNVSVSPIPSANFSTAAACVNSNYTFQDQSTINAGSIIHWDWNIQGLASPDTVSTPAYLFTQAGTYPVKLTVASDIGCSNSITKSIVVHAPPISSFSFNPQFGNPPLNVIITDNSTGAGAYTWDFGDGSNTETIQEPVHLYSDTGVFVIRQYVVSPFGCVDSSSKNIYVIKPVLDIAITGDSSYFENNYFHVVCKLKNLGTREVNNLQLEAKLENGNTIRETLNEVIPNGPAGYKTYSFHASFLINSANEFTYYCVRAINPNGEQDNAPENNEKCINLSDETIVFDPYPNPFTGTLNMHLLLGNPDYVKADLIDVSGQVVKEIYSGKVSKNYLAFSSDLTDLREGIYSIRVIYRDKVIVRNVVKIKQ